MFSGSLVNARSDVLKVIQETQSKQTEHTTW